MGPGQGARLLALILGWSVSQEDRGAAAPIIFEWLRARGPPSVLGDVLLYSPRGPGMTGLCPVCLGLRSRADGQRESRRRVICLPRNCWRVWRPFDFLALLGTGLSRSGVLRIPFWWSFTVWNLSGRPVALPVWSSMGRHRRTEASQGNTMEQYTTPVALPQRTARSEVSGDVVDTPLSAGEPSQAERLVAIQGYLVALEGKIDTVAVEVNLLRADLRKVSDKVKAAEGSIAELQSVVGTLWTQMAQATSTVGRLGAQLEDEEGSEVDVEGRYVLVEAMLDGLPIVILNVYAPKTDDSSFYSRIPEILWDNMDKPLV
ncbi:hypothetical protein NDU88_002857 [Pleurodeles waltl]|uniref:Uncharacterized protein n=1 Tax=Pleurodeles waltl TaxID=8319 RepID=A0AAV7MNW3_PLEWA|nr:hypothetical protein NDU88_002857 [Pleurodeles waltl]